MKKMLILCCLMLGLPVAVQAGNDKIDPSAYVCAELVTQPIAEGGQPPIFEGLQIDGYVSAKMGNPIADPETLAPMLGQAYAACQVDPTKKVATVWQEARKTFPVDTASTWRADKTLCKDYTANPDDGSGFVSGLTATTVAKAASPHRCWSTTKRSRPILMPAPKSPTPSCSTCWLKAQNSFCSHNANKAADPCDRRPCCLCGLAALRGG